jgi:hypothetical protein
MLIEHSPQCGPPAPSTTTSAGRVQVPGNQRALTHLPHDAEHDGDDKRHCDAGDDDRQAFGY